MDRDLLRRKALLAAGSVVLAATLTGCILTGADDATADTAKADTAVADTSTDTDSGDGRPDCSGVDMADTGAYAACCDALTAWCEDAFGAATEPAQECVYGPGFDGSTGCIPWGPPVPPRFRGAVA